MNRQSFLIYLEKINSFLLIERRWFKFVIRTIWILFFSFTIGVPLYVFLVIKNPGNLFGDLPGLQAVENPENDFSSEVISADGVSLGRYFRYNRSQITYNDLPHVLVRTLLISEDHRFHEHAGMDLWSFMRVLKGIITFDKQGGGSTLTQQTAKNLFRTRGDELKGKLAKLGAPIDLLISKTKEWIISVELERNFTKEEIIALYFNTVPFNNNAFGIKIAAETYFNKSLKKLNIQEAALLVGMLQSTFWYNPVEFPDRAIRKRNDVLTKLLDHKYISKRSCDSLKTLPLQLHFSVQNQNQGIATYFRSVLKSQLQQWCKENGYDLSESGLKIYTTIDSRLQMLAEQAMKEQMQKLQLEFDHEWGNRNPWVDENGEEIRDFVQRKIMRANAYKNLSLHFKSNPDSINIMLNRKKRMRIFTWRGERDTVFSSIDSLRYYNRFLQCGLLSMDPSTGEVKAWVGGINHKYFKYDHVHQGKRQPGSTFKPFVYGKAMEDGYSPCQEFLDVSPSININGNIYHPANSGGGFGSGKSFTLRQALAHSLNSVTIQLMDKLRPENVAGFAQRAGISSELDAVYSLGLGTSNVSLEEMVAAYCGFVNLGIYNEPYYVTRIEDKNGNILASFIPKSKQVMSEETAYKTVYLLRGGVEEEGGTSSALSDAVVSNNQIGGKTGTTDNASDGWYIGITHDLVTGVWVGGDEPSIHFPSWKFGSGAHAALPMWDKFMTKVYDHSSFGITKGNFKQPDTAVDGLRNCSDYKVPPDSFDIQ
jgi:penicillin-binding protein 1A